jgi:hypothetical protein
MSGDVPQSQGEVRELVAIPLDADRKLMITDSGYQREETAA